MSALAPDSFDLSSLPSLPLADKAKLPSCAAVYFALSSHNRILYIGRSIDIRERLRGHHRLTLLKSFGDIKIAWLKESNALALRRIEAILIEYFNPPLNKIPAYLKAEDMEKLINYLTLSDRASAAVSNRAPKNNVIPINKFSTSQNQVLEPESLLLSPSDLNEVTLQAKRINHLEEKLADLQLMFQEQMQVHRQLTETLVEQAKTISELSRSQAETNNRLVEVTVEQALTISKLSRESKP
jgi:predicted GIY-YIG superfamily endonuclease